MAGLDDLGVSPTIHGGALSRKLYYMWRYIFIKTQYIDITTFDGFVKSILRTTLSILGDRHLRYSALKNANCLRALARVLAF